MVNPVAGLGGSVALKGSDTEAIQQQASQLGAVPQAQVRARVALEKLQHDPDAVMVYTAAHDMGEYLCRDLGLKYQVVGSNRVGETSPEDTESAIATMLAQGVDLIVFAGGDGTARNVFNALERQQQLRVPVLGIPAGCKIHSGVYTVTPVHAGELLALLARGRPLALKEAQVVDIDEAAFREGVVKARPYGCLRVPAEDRFMQNMKEGGVEQDELVLEDIAQYVIDTMEDDWLYFIGSGSTPKAITDNLGEDGTLLGVDVVQQGKIIGKDATEQQLLEYLENARAKLVVTLIGGQGHVFGRGNQQLSPAVIRKAGKENIMIIATPAKLQGLEGRPLQLDTGDEDLNQNLSGMMDVITGYEQHTLYKMGSQNARS